MPHPVRTAIAKILMRTASNVSDRKVASDIIKAAREIVSDEPVDVHEAMIARSNLMEELAAKGAAARKEAQRVVRNFWVKANVDGRTVEFGPKSKDGGLDLTILHRESGAVGSKPFKVSCWVSGDNLYIEAKSPDGKSIKFESKR